jgi:hypothetical protein
MLTLERLLSLQKVVKIKALYREAGISYSTFNVAKKKNTPLSPGAAQKLTIALQKEGLALSREGATSPHLLTIERLSLLQKFVKVEALCRAAGVSYSTITDTKATEDRSLRQKVAGKLTVALQEQGLLLLPEEKKIHNK